MGRHSTAIAPEAPVPTLEVEVLTPPASPPSKKRKRDTSPAAEIEVDITAPEPPSKKAIRKAKKAKEGKNAPASATADPATEKSEETGEPEASAEKPSNRSEYGIWIGNLSWMTTKKELREFFVKNMEDDAASITRLHLPPPSQTTLMNSKQKVKPANKGFAYVDFASASALADALSMSEKLFSGRKVLIKDAKSFEGRPEPSKGPAADEHTSKPPSKRIFVGNLGFDTTREEIREHFEKCGVVEDVFLTTFEDSGKCKGYGWVTFAEVEDAQKAVRGWVEMVQDAEEEGQREEITEAVGDMSDDRKEALGFQGKTHKKKTRKWWVNRLQGRQLRMESAEGRDVRYKKRYGKGGTKQTAGEPERDAGEGPSASAEESAGASKPERPARTMNMGKYRPPERRIDARTIKPGAALAAAPRLTGGIVQSQGKKTTFG